MKDDLSIERRPDAKASTSRTHCRVDGGRGGEEEGGRGGAGNKERE